ncbi:MAG: DUF1707 SHOCT-like domain-containing protein [Solirubrobacteraceae bacterium]
MRLSDGDRELLFEKLNRHAAAGRLGIEELERRVALIVQAQTQAQASAAMADLPPLPLQAPRRRPRRGAGHGDADTPAPEWQPTNERFRDPRSERVMRVWVDSAGGRHYVADEE